MDGVTDARVLGSYTTRAIEYLEDRGITPNKHNIIEMRLKLYRRDIEIASVADGKHPKMG